VETGVASESESSYDQFAVAEMRRLLGLALALTGDRHDAWDLTQETLVRVGERWRSVRTNPGAYARTVMVRLNIDRLRRARRELLPGTTPDRAVDVPLVEGAPRWLLEALATLSPRQRTALALRHVEDLDVAGVAERMNCSVGTAKSHLSRGTERLRAHAAAAGITSTTREERHG
jgi:RNA polymerase sigma-70 factor (sigma-E family)